MVILGLCDSHNSSAAIAIDGEIVAALSEERVSGVKNHASETHLSTQALLDAHGLSLSDFDRVYYNPLRRAEPLSKDEAEFRAELSSCADVVTVWDHHLLHAYYAYASAPTPTAAVLVADGVGSALKANHTSDAGFEIDVPEPCAYQGETVFRAGPDSIERVFEVPVAMELETPALAQVSIGRAYGAASRYLFGSMHASGKVMGLAAHGAKASPTPHSDIALTVDSIMPLRTSRSDEYWADRRLAFDIQQTAERELAKLYDIASGLDTTICIAGGVGLNCTANGKLIESRLFEDVILPPAQGDDGIAIGAALFGVHRSAPNQPTPRLNYASDYRFLGPERNPKDAVARAAAQEFNVTDLSGGQRAAAFADQLQKHGAVALFEGRSEFGPRALGHRSIIGLPTHVDIRSYLNTSVKFREFFRPMAPVCCEEDFGRYFDADLLGQPCSTMLCALPYKPAMNRYPCFITQDGKARIQVVKQGEFMWDLLQVLKTTGVDLILNTSLNGRDQPILETPDDFVSFLASSRLQAGMIDTFLLEK